MVAPPSFYNRPALNPINLRELELLLLSLGFNQDNPLRIRQRLDVMREQERRKLFDLALQYKDLRSKWIKETENNTVAFGFPKRPRSQLTVKLERAVNKLVFKIRKGLLDEK